MWKFERGNKVKGIESPAGDVGTRWPRGEGVAFFTLFHLPPYSPEYNPDEYLNNDLKQSIGTQAMVQDIQELESNTSAFMNRLSSDPDHVKAYFDHPALTKYKLD